MSEENLKNEETGSSKMVVDPLMEKVSKVIESSLNYYDNVSFSLGNQVLTNDNIAKPEGLLSIWALEIATIYKDMFGKDSTLYYYKEPDSICEVLPAIEETGDTDNNLITLLHCANYAVTNLVKTYLKEYEKENGFKTRGMIEVPLDNLYNNWFNAAERQELRFSMDYKQKSPGYHSSYTR